MTQMYAGTKFITAWEAEKDGEAGYAVKYADGYQSWSPKAAFEETYVALGNIEHYPPYIQRLIFEFQTLVTNYRKLSDFISDEVNMSRLDHRDLALMDEQRGAMYPLIRILSDRLAREIAKNELASKKSISLDTGIN